jgi:hypothetical protein
MEGEKEGQMKSILDRSFKYTPSSKTDLRKTFAKVRREQCLNTKPTVVQNQFGRIFLGLRLGRCPDG